MTVQQALKAAHDCVQEAFARPADSEEYVYRYVRQGRQNLIEINGRNGRGQIERGFWRTMSQQELEAAWIVCDIDGRPIKESSRRGPAISDLL